MLSLDHLSDLQKDALKELGNIGAGHAATALSQLLNATIKLGEPTIEVIKFRDVSARMGLENHTVAAMHLFVRGEAPGQIVVLFEKSQAMDFVRVFLRRIIGDINIYESLQESTLKELGNIIAGAYLTALTALTEIHMLPSVPTLSYGTVSEALKSVVSILPEQAVFLIESPFFDNGMKITGQVMLIPEAGSVEPLLSVFGVS